MKSSHALPNKGQIIVFDLDEKVIGYAILVWVWTNEFGKDILWIDEVVVDKNYRGLGIGKRFFDWLQLFFGESPAFSLLVSEYNHKAKKLYQEIGFKSIQTQMLKVNNVIDINKRTNTKEAVLAI